MNCCLVIGPKLIFSTVLCSQENVYDKCRQTLQVGLVAENLVKKHQIISEKLQFLSWCVLATPRK